MIALVGFSNSPRIPQCRKAPAQLFLTTRYNELRVRRMYCECLLGKQAKLCISIIVPVQYKHLVKVPYLIRDIPPGVR